MTIDAGTLRSNARDAAVSLTAGALRGTAIAAMSAGLLLGAIVTLYFVKSAMGINLMAGPSPLHNLYVMIH